MAVMPSVVDGSNGPAKLVLTREPKKSVTDTPGKDAVRDSMMIVIGAAVLLLVMLYPVRRFIV